MFALNMGALPVSHDFRDLGREPALGCVAKVELITLLRVLVCKGSRD